MTQYDVYTRSHYLYCFQVFVCYIEHMKYTQAAIFDENVFTVAGGIVS